MKKDIQHQEIENLNAQLQFNILYSSSRNYLEGSVYVERSGRIIGLCLDQVDPKILNSLNIDSDHFPFLQDLVIRNSDVDELPDWIYNFKQIENLVLKSLKISDINQLSEELGQIKFLALPDNEISIIKYLAGFQELFRLNLNKNQLEAFPEGIENLDNLVSMTINENYLKSAPSIIESNILQAVSLRNNQLNQVPEFLKDQKQLHHLDLSANFISELPNWIGTLQSLEYLFLSHNQIKEVPEFITELSKLSFLKIDHNFQLKLNPSIIYSLEKLREIDITSNKEALELRHKLLAFQKMSEKNFRVIY